MYKCPESFGSVSVQLLSERIAEGAYQEPVTLEPVLLHPLRFTMHLKLMLTIEKGSGERGAQLGAVNLQKVMTKHRAVR